MGQAKKIVDTVLGEHEVGRQHVETRPVEPTPRLPGAIALLHMMTEVGKDTGDELANLPVRLNNKNPCHQRFSTTRAGVISQSAIKHGLT